MFGQDSLVVVWEETKEPIAFATLTEKGTLIGFSDNNGLIVFEKKSLHDSLLLSAFGGNPIYISGRERFVEMKTVATEILSVTIKEKEDTAAIRIMREVHKRRKTFDPIGMNNYTMESYGKHKVTIKADTIITDSQDSAITAFVTRSDLLTLENHHLHIYRKNKPEEEQLIAYNISGLRDNFINRLVNQIKGGSIYKEYIDFDGTYRISPVSPKAEKSYIFDLTDTLVINGDSLYKVFFWPRRNPDKAVKGYVLVDMKSYAIRLVDMRAGNNDDMVLKQEYQVVDNIACFKKIYWNINLNALEYKGILSGQVSYFNLEKGKYKGAEMPDYHHPETTYWDSIRTYEYTERDSVTYRTIDSVGNEIKLNKKVVLMKALLSGRLPVGPVSVDLPQTIGFNNYEGVTLGLGLYTNDRLFKRVSFGGYFRYGTKDKVLKYGGRVEFWPEKSMKFKITGLYKDDVISASAMPMEYLPYSILPVNRIEALYVNKKDYQRKAELGFTYEFTRNLQVTAFVDAQQRAVQYDNYYYYIDGEIQLREGEKFGLSEWGLEFKYKIRNNNFRLSKDFEIPRVSFYPEIFLRLENAFKIDGLTDYNYFRYNFYIQELLPIRRLGKVRLAMSLKGTLGEVPADLLFYASGTYDKNFGLWAYNTFQTMNPNRYLTRHVQSVYFQYIFPEIKTGFKFFEPEFLVHYALGKGWLTDDEASKHLNLGFTQFNGLYQEAGILINQFIATDIISLGFGGFVRFGEYWQDGSANNFSFKFSIKVRTA